MVETNPEQADRRDWNVSHVSAIISTKLKRPFHECTYWRNADRQNRRTLASRMHWRIWTDKILNRRSNLECPGRFWTDKILKRPLRECTGEFGQTKSSSSRFKNTQEDFGQTKYTFLSLTHLSRRWRFPFGHSIADDNGFKLIVSWPTYSIVNSWQVNQEDRRRRVTIMVHLGAREVT